MRPTKMMNLHEIWRRITSTRCKRALEFEIARLHAEAGRASADVARLRDENRALLNSILGIAGIPPVTVPPQNTGVLGTTNSAEIPRSHPSSQTGPDAPAAGPALPLTDGTQPERAVATRGKNLAQIAAPVRRRSWQQINRTLELEAARKKPTEAERQ